MKIALPNKEWKETVDITSTLRMNIECVITYRVENNGLYVVWWTLFLLFLNCSAYLCLGPAKVDLQNFFSTLYVWGNIFSVPPLSVATFMTRQTKFQMDKTKKSSQASVMLKMFRGLERSLSPPEWDVCSCWVSNGIEILPCKSEETAIQLGDLLLFALTQMGRTDTTPQ